MIIYTQICGVSTKRDIELQEIYDWITEQKNVELYQIMSFLPATKEIHCFAAQFNYRSAKFMFTFVNNTTLEIYTDAAEKFFNAFLSNNKNPGEIV